MGHLKEIKERLLEETPDFHKKNRKFGFGLVGLGITLKILAILFPATTVVGLASLAPEIMTLGVGIATGSSLASKNR